MLALIIVFVLIIAFAIILAMQSKSAKTANEAITAKRPRSRARPLVTLDPIIPDNKPSTGTQVRFSDMNPVREYDKITGTTKDITPAPMAAAAE